MIYVMFLLNGLLLLWALYVAYKSSHLVTPWLVVFTCIWAFPVGVIWFFNGGADLEYALKIFNGMSMPDEGDEKVLFLTVLVFFAAVSSLIGALLSNKTYHPSLKMRVSIKNPLPLSVICFLFWVGVVFLITSSNGVDASYVFLPAYSEDNIYVNYIFRSAYLYIPYLAAYFLISSRERGRFLFLILAWGVIVAFSTGQRRDFLSYILFVFFLIIAYRYKNFSISNVWSFRKFCFLFLGGFLLIVALWSARVFFSNLIAGNGFVNPLEFRGFFEVIFGSGATGMPTLYVIDSWVNANGASYFYNIIYGLSQVFPRFMWSGKPVGIDSIIQSYYGMSDSPSPFWFGDLAYSYGALFLPLSSFLMSFYVTFIQNFIYGARKNCFNILSAFLFCNVFALYKNGLGTYLAIVLTGLMIIYFFYAIAIMFSKREKGLINVQ